MAHSTRSAHQDSAPFRQHDAVTVPWASPLLRQLCEEWVVLNHSPIANAAARAWALLDAPTVGAVVDGIDRAETGVKDASIHALLELHRDGDRVAGRVLLQAMLPGLVDLARRGRAPRSETSFDDQVQRAVTEFWGVISLERNLAVHGVAGRLLLDTLNRFSSHRRSSDAWEEHTWYYPDWDTDGEGSWESERVAGTIGRSIVSQEAAEAEQVISTLTGELDPSGDLIQLLAWARVEGAIDDDEVNLLVEVYLCGDRDLKQTALRLGLPHATLRKRVSRTRQALAEAVRAETAA